MTKQLKVILIAMWVVVGVAVGGVVAGVLIYRSMQPNRVAAASSRPTGFTGEHHLEKLFDAPPFNLTDQNGKHFDSSELRGKVWVADFIFTSCTSFCPLMTQQLADFQNKTSGSAGLPIQMVSFSVDPVHDTPAALTDYAHEAKADPARWHFLTGEDKETLWNISRSMKLAVDNGDEKDHQVMHSSHFLLVDRDGHVRGIYDYKNAGFMAQMIADAKELSR